VERTTVSFGLSCTSSSNLADPALNSDFSGNGLGFRIPIDYGFAEAETVAGKIGVKCWICKKVEEEVQDKPKETVVRSTPTPEVEAPAAV